MRSKLIARSTLTSAGFRELSPSDVAEAHTTERLIDIREPREYTGDLGHIPGTELVPFGTIDRAAKRWDKSEPLVLICRSGGRSAPAAAVLIASGFTCVMSMVGGMLAWTAAKLPVER